jgi:large subunit ribosomal protein L17
MRHKVAGYKLGRNTAHRRSLLRNLVTSVIVEERIETTVPKAKAAKPIVEKMITLGKRGDLAARRLAAAYLMTNEAVVKLFDTVGPRFGDRQGGYTRIIRTHWNKGDGADKAFLELLGSEKVLDEKKEKRTEARAKKAAEAKRKSKIRPPGLRRHGLAPCLFFLCLATTFPHSYMYDRVSRW